VTALLSPRTLDRLSGLDVATRRGSGGGRMGERAAGVAGSGTIFREHRKYTPGDDLRYVDWNAYGRLRKLHVKVFEAEENLDVHLLVDATGSMGAGPGSKLHAGVRAAAMIAATALSRGDLVRVCMLPHVATKAYLGTASAHQVISALTATSGAKVGSLYDAVRAAMPPSQRRGLAVLVTDFLDQTSSWRRAVDYLRHVRAELCCLHVVSPLEREPSVGGTLRLRDAETGETEDLEVDDDLLERYRARFDKRLRDVRAYLLSKRVRHVLIDSGRAGEPELLRQLVREGVLR
jgi:uncharacterized protein (DUF58 family)